MTALAEQARHLACQTKDSLSRAILAVEQQARDLADALAQRDAYKAMADAFAETVRAMRSQEVRERTARGDHAGAAAVAEAFNNLEQDVVNGAYLARKGIVKS